MIVLDTHAWIWFAGDDRFLSPAALEAVRHADRIGVSPISIWEVSMLCAKGRLALDGEVDGWVARASAFGPALLVAGDLGEHVGVFDGTPDTTPDVAADTIQAGPRRRDRVLIVLP